MVWVIVLAGGSGTRLAEVARRRYGYARPKQFCDFDGRGTLLAHTLERARALVPDERIVVVTVAPHRAEVDEVLAAYPAVLHLEQPDNRDTTAGILLPALEVLARDPEGRVVVLPSDHSIADRGAFVRAVHDALDIVLCAPSRVAVLGAAPSGLEDGVGWLVPAPDADPRAPAVARFREKPGPPEALELALAGARVNTFILAARARTLVDAVAEHCPTTWRLVSSGLPLGEMFAALPASSFSRDVLERIAPRLTIVPLPERAGWSDVGTPERLARACWPHGDGDFR